MASDEPRPGSPSEADQLLLTWAREAPDGQARDLRLGHRLHLAGDPAYAVPRLALPWLLDGGRDGSRGDARRAAATAWDAAGRPLADDAVLGPDDPRAQARDEGWTWTAPPAWTEGPAVAAALLGQLHDVGSGPAAARRAHALRRVLSAVLASPPPRRAELEVAADDEGPVASAEERLAVARERLAGLRDLMAPSAWEQAVLFEAGLGGAA